MNNPHRTILVFGATGQQGGAVAWALLRAGWHVRAFVRDADGPKAQTLKGAGAELAVGTFEDTASLRAACAGVHGVFSVQPNSGQGPGAGVSDDDEVRYGIAVADIAHAAGVKHFIYSSAQVSGDRETGVPNFDTKVAIERHIRSLDMPYTVVRPSTFMEILATPGWGLQGSTLSFLLRPDQAGQFIAVDDIGRIVAKLFGDAARYASRTVELAGDVATGDELAIKFGRALGRELVYRRFPDSLLAQNPTLAKVVALTDSGQLDGKVDLPAFRREFGPLLSLDEWLDGSGRDVLLAAQR